MLVAKIPIGKFDDTKSQGLLSSQLFHASMNIITEPLKACSRNPVNMIDPAGNIRHVRTVLAAYLANYPEQLMIACTSASVAPSSLATHNSPGQSNAHPLQHGKRTIQMISRLKKQVNPLDIQRFKLAAKRMGLNGVIEPFWHKWKFADPCQFLAPDALHQWHKMFMDHAYQWARHWLGDHELDHRLSVLQPRIGFRHFPQGITRFKQHTGHEQWDLECLFLCIIAGHPNVTNGIMQAMRCYMDFIYIAQYESHSTHTLQYLDKALKGFHQYKNAISASGARDGPRRQGEFNIQKLELMHHVSRLIRFLGSAEQFSADQTEHCHITMAKVPYHATNKKEYAAQMCRFIDREEKVNLFSAWLEWTQSNSNEIQALHPISSAFQLYGSSMQPRVYINRFQSIQGVSIPKFKNLFTSSEIACTDTTAFHLTGRISRQHVPLNSIASFYHIPDFPRAVSAVSKSSWESICHFTADIWDQIQIQCRKRYDDTAITPAQTVQALPPSPQLSFGRCNFVMVKNGTDEAFGSIQGHFVAQVRLIFQAKILNGNHQLPKTFLYIECMKPAPHTFVRQHDGTQAFVPDDRIEMFHLIRATNRDESRHGMIISLQQVWRSVQLVPKFGSNCPEDWTCDTSLELAEHFYLNCFLDKETYQTVY